MSSFDDLSSRVIASVSSLVLSAFFLAVAVIPASPTVLHSGVFA